LKRIIDYDWSISYGLRLTTSIVDRGLVSVAVFSTNQKFAPNVRTNKLFWGKNLTGCFIGLPPYRTLYSYML